MPYTRLNSRDNFIDYCLRRLGHPVIEINVDDEQIEDRVNDALQLFTEYAAEGSYKVFLPVAVTQDMVTRKAIDFDLDTTALPDADDILSVIRVLPFDTSSGSTSFMDVKYQMRLNDLWGMGSGIGSSVASYEMMQQYMSLIDMKLTGHPQIQFKRETNTIQILGDFESGDLKVGDNLMIEMYVASNANNNGKLYDNLFLKEYATALIKEQWGSNLIKFEGMTLPGGIQLNGRQIYEDAKQEIETIRQRIYNEYDTPPDFFVG